MAESLCNIDILIASIIAISVLIGFFRGAIKEILTVVSWIGAILLTILLFPLGKNIISNFIQQPLLVDLVTYVVVFVVFLVILSAFTYLFSSVVKNSVLAVPNRLCGGLFGILRGILILAVLDFGISQYVSQDYEEYVKESKLRPYVKETSKMIFIMLPEGLRQSILKHLSLEQQKALLERFDISNNDISNTQTIAQQENNNNEAANIGIIDNNKLNNNNMSINNNSNNFNTGNKLNNNKGNINNNNKNGNNNNSNNNKNVNNKNTSNNNKNMNNNQKANNSLNKSNTNINNNNKNDNNKSNNNSVNSKLNSINNDSFLNKNKQNDKANNHVGQTAQELSKLKVKESDSSTFFKETKKDLDKLLDIYT